MIDPEPLLAFAARQHPAVVHFPIALVLTGAFLELLLCLARREDWIAAQRVCLRLAGWGALAAAATGWLFADAAAATEPPEVTLHRWLGVACAVAVFVVGCFVPRWPESERAGFRGMLTLTTMLVAVTGHFGAYLVHGPEQFGVG
jgi:uncharacterized membrane protein